MRSTSSWSFCTVSAWLWLKCCVNGCDRLSPSTSIAFESRSLLATEDCESRGFSVGSFTCSIIADFSTAFRLERSASHADRSFDIASSFFFWFPRFYASRAPLTPTSRIFLSISCVITSMSFISFW